MVRTIGKRRPPPTPVSSSSSSSDSDSEEEEEEQDSDDDEVQEIPNRGVLVKKRRVVATNFYRPVTPRPCNRRRRRAPATDKDDVIPSFRKPLATKISEVQDQEAKDKEGICSICLINKVRLIYGPCNHGCFCVTCYRKSLSEAIKKPGADCMECPLCKAEVKTVAPFYVA